MESCGIQYRLEGLKEYADKVDFQVYGSKYCKCTDWNKGLGKYTELPDTPLFEQTGNSASERKQGEILTKDPKTKKKGRGWKGQVSTAEGILGVKAKGKERYINVAFSPYSVLLRYYIDAGDKTAGPGGSAVLAPVGGDQDRLRNHYRRDGQEGNHQVE